MSKVLVEIDLPQNVAGTALEKKPREVLSRQALEMAVLQLYHEREISTETGADLLNISLADFFRFLGENKISVFYFTEEERQKEFETASLT